MGRSQGRNAGLQAGADDVLSKPVDRQELLLRVRSFQRLWRQDLQIRRQLEELARAHGGDVSVGPRADGGSLYRFVVPLKP